MKCKLAAKFLLSALTLWGSVAIATSSDAQPVSGSTSFTCGQDKATGQLATIAQKGSSTVALLVWAEQNPYFGDKFTPVNRCNIVTSKLNAALSANGGSLQNLLLTNGVVNGEAAICTLNGGVTACSTSNLLFTLKPENASQAGEILAQLIQLGPGNVAANAIQKSSSSQVYVNLGIWEAGVMGTGASR